MQWIDFVPYLVLAIFLLAGLLVYEKTGLRLGGVLVIPLLMFYSIAHVGLLFIFAASVAVAIIAGAIVRSTTFLYGRRLLIVYIVAGMLCAGLLLTRFLPDYPAIALAVLPGIFAFNMHRESRPVQATAVFGAIFLVGGFLLHLLVNPVVYPDATPIGQPASLQGQTSLEVAGPLGLVVTVMESLRASVEAE